MPKEIIRQFVIDTTKVLLIDLAAIIYISKGDLTFAIQCLVGLSAFGFTMWKWACAIRDRRELKNKKR